MRHFDYRGVPPQLIPAIATHVTKGFLSCNSCAVHARARDQKGLFERAQRILDVPVASHSEELPLIQVLTTAALTQEAFWLGLAADFGPTVAPAQHMPAGFRLWFNVLNAGLQNTDHATFHNGVELWCWPYGETLTLEEIRSHDTGAGHAGRVMRYVIAAADKFEAALFGVVESHHVTGISNTLSDEALFEWYGRLGFLRQGPVANGIIRDPQIDRPQEEIDAAYESAYGAINKVSA